MRSIHFNLIAVVLLGLAGCGGTMRSYGYKAIETRADDAKVNAAVYETARGLAKRIPEPGGREYIPSWAEDGQTLGDPQHPDLRRSRISFADASGTNYTIERVNLQGHPTLILLDASKEEAAMDLHNRLSTALMRRTQ